ncbi:D-aminoacyl-tRNA deacylase [Jeotgalibaca porci]|uniref:D-aminoacyl-tRNA deacylase n=1 Tax=Jeotgalibaca porci TaxID=1868793 RepID=A0A6G7WEF2_9LACT|nr:D-aminoacyl-tRNA deacylase [Jeotgalibaca porci]NLB99450.1 D-tyrosyl-tRNA(Tyr) deacylase [Lactobacillales bacterium]QIK50660.1 D-tyrosyl-tRNA(Tyr) deacylase [Jeotgalibaca porci]
MRVVIQKVSEASVSVEGQSLGAIKKGFMLLVGVGQEDTEVDVDYLARKIANLRVFEDEQGKMNLALKDVAGEILSISQFTLLANTKKGNRPSFIEAAAPETGDLLYEKLNASLRAEGFTVKTGQFGAHMQVQLINDGPVTILIDSKNK